MVAFSKLAPHLQRQVAEKLPLHDYANFVQSSSQTLKMEYIKKKKILWRWDKVTMLNMLNDDIGFFVIEDSEPICDLEKKKHDFLCEWLFELQGPVFGLDTKYKLLFELTKRIKECHVRIIARHFTIWGTLTQQFAENLVEFFLNAKFMATAFSFCNDSGMLTCTPEIFDTLVYMTRLKTAILPPLTSEVYFQTAAVKNLEDIFCNAPVCNTDFLALKARKLSLIDTTVTPRTMNRFLREWQAGERDCCSVRIYTTEKVDVKLVLSQLRVSGPSQITTKFLTFVVTFYLEREGKRLEVKVFDTGFMAECPLGDDCDGCATRSKF